MRAGSGRRTASAGLGRACTRRRSPVRVGAAVGVAAAVLGLVLGLVLAGCSGSSGSSGSTDLKAGVVSVPAADRGAAVDVSGTTLEGAKVDLDSYRGKVVVVNVWGAFCLPCRAESKEIEHAWTMLGPTGVPVIGINRDPDVATAKAFQHDFGMTYPSLRYDSGTLLGFRGAIPAKAVPATLVLDPQGRPAVRILGATTAAKIEAAVAQVRASA